ncbi:sulfatase-like hydrolase/transferase [bacterium]|nr:sulfatase-like hydrolase/transferase [bacterium]
MRRRTFVKAGAALAASTAFGAPAVGKKSKPNILFIMTDQQGIDTISAAGCSHVQTPALDGLCERGVRFDASYSSNPVCSPARSVMLTGRTSCETGVWTNGKPIHASRPNMGQWLSAEGGYEPVYVGKWHLPGSFTHRIPGFNVLTAGVSGQGNLGDTSTSRACEAFLRNRSSSIPFAMVASFFQPHDICQWLRINQADPGGIRFRGLEAELPPLPANFDYDRREPAAVARQRAGNEPGPKKGSWSALHWRYYIWSYYRHIEMVDAEIGRVLRALDAAGLTKDTLVLFTSDHGEGLGQHQMVRKNNLYDAAARVPMIASLPGRVAQGKADGARLVSHLDLLPTMCDYAGIAPPKGVHGRSLRPWLEGGSAPWHPCVVTEVLNNSGRMVRTARYKYTTYRDDPVEQLFDMKADPGEMKNLATDPKHAAALAEHRKLLRDWERRIEPAPGCPNPDAWRKR